MDTVSNYCYACDYMSDQLAQYPLDDTGEVVNICIPCYDRITGKGEGA